MNSPLRQRGCRESRSGFTLFEILIILAITAVALFFATAGTSGQASYYFLRGDVEKLVSGLQRAAIQSASRGELSNTGAVRAGLTFYLGRRAVGTVGWENLGHSFLNWFEGDPLRAVPRNRVAITLLGPEPRTLLKTLQLETILTREYIPGVPVTRLTDAAYCMFKDGKLDVFAPDGTVAVGGHRTELALFFLPQNSPLAAGVPVAYSFDVVNQNTGWVRVRMYTGGFVEVSGINALSVAVPTNSSGGAF